METARQIQIEEGMIPKPAETEAEKESGREGERKEAIVLGVFLCRKFNFLLKKQWTFLMRCDKIQSVIEMNGSGNFFFRGKVFCPASTREKPG